MVSVHVFSINGETRKQNVVKLKKQSSILMKKKSMFMLISVATK